MPARVESGFLCELIAGVGDCRRSPLVSRMEMESVLFRALARSGADSFDEARSRRLAEWDLQKGARPPADYGALSLPRQRAQRARTQR